MPYTILLGTVAAIGVLLLSRAAEGQGQPAPPAPALGLPNQALRLNSNLPVLSLTLTPGVFQIADSPVNGTLCISSCQAAAGAASPPMATPTWTWPFAGPAGPAAPLGPRCSLAYGCQAQISVTIEQRGRSSRVYPKKQFNLKARNLGAEELLGLTATTSWVLQGPYPDVSLMRAALGLNLGAAQELWSPDVRFLEAFVLGESGGGDPYRGVYMMIERIRPGRVVADGGWLVQASHGPTDDYWDKTLNLTPDVPLMQFGNQRFYLEGPSSARASAAADLRAVNEALRGPQEVRGSGAGTAAASSGQSSLSQNRRRRLLQLGGGNKALQIPAVVNLTSFADFFLLQELSLNPDAYLSSTYLFKPPGVASPVSLGPPWDFDLSFGLMKGLDVPQSAGWRYKGPYTRVQGAVPVWYASLLTDPGFTAVLGARWRQLRLGPWSDSAIGAWIDRTQALLRESVDRNFARWPKNQVSAGGLRSSLSGAATESFGLGSGRSAAAGSLLQRALYGRQAAARQVHGLANTASSSSGTSTVTAGGRSFASAAAAAPPAAAPAATTTATMAQQCAAMSSFSRWTVGLWMAGLTAWVYSMVVIGGYTRLTRSGLSMTDWRFVETPPQGDAEWAAEFEKYRLSPEFRRVNSRMSLEDFKYIYWVEWSHRQWGRALGFFFLGPWLLFLARGMLPRTVNGRVLAAAGLGAVQAGVGWWMVKSGLVEPEDDHATPRVSPYRLAFHLTTAAVIYMVLLWNTMQVLVPVAPAAGASEAALKALSKLRGRAAPVAAIAGVTALSGAFVAGNDAGHAYNTWPDMNGGIWPPGEEPFPKEPAWRNVFEHTPLVQFDHRMLAYTTLTATTALWLWGRGLGPLPRPVGFLLAAAAAAAWGQVALGIATLLSYVPVGLGTAHQGGALVLLSLLTGLLHATRDAGAPFWSAFMRAYGLPLSVALGLLGAGAALAVDGPGLHAPKAGGGAKREIVA